jgi:hypothetical protein
MSEGTAGSLLPQGLHARAVPEPAGGAATSQVPNGHVLLAAPSVGEICDRLIGFQGQRVFAIRMQVRCDNAAGAFVRTRLGFRTDLPEKERNRISAEARRIKEAVERGQGLSAVARQGQTDGVLAACSAVILASAASRKCWDEMRDDCEYQMEAFARQLPVWPFCNQVRGVGKLGLAVIVGEAGDLCGYPKHGHLWKRLGLAVIDGKRQGSVPANLGREERAEAWTERGYNPNRRAQVWSFLDDSLLRGQWRGGKDDGPGYPLGPYGEKYARKKAEYLARDDIAAPDAAARRYMAKCFVRDLWREWRRTTA